MNKISLIIPLGIGREVEYLKEIEKQKAIGLITEYGNNTSANRNKGMEKAKTELVAFINGHTLLSENWGEKVLEFFEKNKEIDIVGGPQFTASSEKGFAKISGYALSSRFGAWKIANRYSGKKMVMDADETMLTSANLICRKKVFKKVKFNENIYPGEDPKFISDAKEAGFKVAYSPEIIVYNKRRASLAALAKQIFTYGETRPEKESFKETLKRPFFLIPSVFVMYLLLLFLVSLPNIVMTGNVVGSGTANNLGIIIVIPLVAYFFLSIIFSAGNALLNRDMPVFFVLPLVYFVIHISYGAGFLYGTFKKLR